MQGTSDKYESIGSCWPLILPLAATAVTTTSPSFEGDAFRIPRGDGRAFPQGLSHRMQRRKPGGMGRLGQVPEWFSVEGKTHLPSGPLVNGETAIEHGHWYLVTFPIQTWWFSIAMLVSTEGYQLDFWIIKHGFQKERISGSMMITWQDHQMMSVSSGIYLSISLSYLIVPCLIYTIQLVHIYITHIYI